MKQFESIYESCFLFREAFSFSYKSAQSFTANTIHIFDIICLDIINIGSSIFYPRYWILKSLSVTFGH